MKKLFPFDECYLINLVERPDRLEYMMNQFSNLNCENEIILRQVVKRPDWIMDFIKNHINDNDKFIGSIDESHTISCTIEHYTLIKSAYLRGLESVMIIEDDCGFIKDRSILEEYFSNLPNDWDILRINCLRGQRTQEYINKYSDKYSYWFPQISTLFGTSSYVLNRNGMKYILDWYDKYISPVDTPFAQGNSKKQNPCLSKYENNISVNFYIPKIPLGLCTKFSLDSDIRNFKDSDQNTIYNFYKNINDIKLNNYY